MIKVQFFIVYASVIVLVSWRTLPT